MSLFSLLMQLPVANRFGQAEGETESNGKLDIFKQKGKIFKIYFSHENILIIVLFWCQVFKSSSFLKLSLLWTWVDFGWIPLDVDINYTFYNINYNTIFPHSFCPRPICSSDSSTVICWCWLDNAKLPGWLRPAHCDIT